MKISDFFTASTGEKAKLYTLTNGTGFEVDVTDWGGTLTALRTPGRDGMVDVLLGYKNPADYEANSPYIGALIGRFANRIPKIQRQRPERIDGILVHDQFSVLQRCHGIVKIHLFSFALQTQIQIINAVIPHRQLMKSREPRQIGGGTAILLQPVIH